MLCLRARCLHPLVVVLIFSKIGWKALESLRLLGWLLLGKEYIAIKAWSISWVNLIAILCFVVAIAQLALELVLDGERCVLVLLWCLVLSW